VKLLTKRRQKKLISLLVTLVLAGIGWLATRQQTNPQATLGTMSPGTYHVTQFYDGDTIAVDMSGKQEKIRLIGVDTPETHDPRKAVECFGQAASDFTKQLIGDQPVRLESDALSSNRDRYDRLLRYVYLPDGRLVQAEIIKQGYGFAYVGFPFTKMDEFRSLEQQARDNNRGLWNNCQTNIDKNGQIHADPE
jgi:endonuclease YncB( thermonuclease family)